jgi:tetratricopeptide (TPR) repeat protein
MEELNMDALGTEDLAAVNDALSRQIVEVVEAGNGLHSQGNLDAARAKYQQAWSLLPEPPTQWDLAQWIADCMAEIFFEQGRYAESKAWAMIAVDTKPPRETSSWIVFAKACIELGETDLAVQYLGKAYALGKKRAFQGFDKKYLAFYLERAKR